VSKQCTTHHFACDCREEKFKELKRENAALRELAARMATEMREVDHEFASLRDYDARKEAQP
jgi:predicted nuclease with TOPRIM domain